MSDVSIMFSSWVGIKGIIVYKGVFNGLYNWMDLLCNIKHILVCNSKTEMQTDF